MATTPSIHFKVVVIRASYWNQIVSDMENLCGMPSEEIEILKDAQVGDLEVTLTE